VQLDDKTDIVSAVRKEKREKKKVRLDNLLRKKEEEEEESALCLISKTLGNSNRRTDKFLYCPFCPYVVIYSSFSLYKLLVYGNKR
jgi:hypothetical protein